MIDDFCNYLDAQLRAIDEFKWELGVKLGHDPLNDYTINEIAFMWIELYAADFREKWYNKHISYSGVIDGICNQHS